MTTIRRAGSGISPIGGLRRLGPGRPVAERPFSRRERRLGVDVADDREQGVVGRVVRGVEVDEIVARDPPHRLRGAVRRLPVGVRRVDQPREDDPRQVLRVVVADLEPRQHLLALALDLGRRERRVSGGVGDHVQPELEAVGHDEDVDEGQVRARAGAENAADRVDGVRDFGGAPARRALVEERARECRDPRLAGRVVRRSGSDEQPQVDRGLLVVHHHHHPQTVVEGPDLVGRERRLVPRQRGRRALPRPVHRLLGQRRRRDRRQAEEQEPAPCNGRIGWAPIGCRGATLRSRWSFAGAKLPGRRGAGQAGGARAGPRARGLAHSSSPGRKKERPGGGAGRIVSTSRFSSVK